MASLDPELIGLETRTGCNILYCIARGDVKDNFSPGVHASAKVIEACLHIFKNTPEVMALKIDGYITSGVGGLLKISGGRKSTQIKSEIRDLIKTGLYEILKNKRSYSNNDLPIMNYANYKKLNVICFWKALSEAEWDVKRKKRLAGTQEKMRATRSDKGKSKKGQSYKSRAIMESDEDEEVDSEICGAAEHKRSNEDADNTAEGTRIKANFADTTPNQLPNVQPANLAMAVTSVTLSSSATNNRSPTCSVHTAIIPPSSSLSIVALTLPGSHGYFLHSESLLDDFQSADPTFNANQISLNPDLNPNLMFSPIYRDMNRWDSPWLSQPGGGSESTNGMQLDLTDMPTLANQTLNSACMRPWEM
ncbi:hypothetical protein SERLADRAFT_431819 [Serpula lacrymans var. lacrymans S7.9]|uniref:Uncharacterized protein n=1 Tax=Serpula lacrymans var. lacrymans (strain S7.9) TaxID=578457 RepID=F8NDM7_SERL9|nr:uncharacterized protein SERLADRAFT_431819 [Serpula lacrymans var. lacrymans S7.9]EGO30311.1 hypothetical protein SERLADRAFT_431819 [Serpula lacrymans var. lacrymans S7.9]